MLFPSLRKRIPAILAAASLLVATSLLVSARAQDAAPTPGQAHIEEVLRGLSRGRSVGQVAVAPDGRHLAWIERTQAGEEIRVAPLTDLAAGRRITAASDPGQHCREGAIAWSPDSSALAFFSDCARPGEQLDLYIAPLAPVVSQAPGAPTDRSSSVGWITPARRLTALNGYVQAPAFSPDGKSIAFLYVEGATRPAGALAAQDLPSGVIGEEKSDIQRVAVTRLDVAAPNASQVPAVPTDGSSSVSWITPPNLHVFEFNWAPDSRSLAYIAADPPGENNWWVARLYTQQIGSAPTVVLDPATVSGPLHGLQIAVPRWSPDGKSIAFIGGLMSDQGVTGGDLWIVPSSGGEPRAGGQPIDLTPHRPTSPAWMAWDGDRTLFVSELAGADSQLVRFRLSPDRTSATAVSTVFSIPATVGDGRMSRSLSTTADRSLFVFTASGFNDPPEIYSIRSANPPPNQARELTTLTRLSHFNAGIETAWGKSVSLDWTNQGFHVQGWLLFPLNYDPAKKYPLLVEVHGGPASAVVARWGAAGSLSPAAFSSPRLLRPSAQSPWQLRPG